MYSTVAPIRFKVRRRRAEKPRPWSVPCLPIAINSVVLVRVPTIPEDELPRVDDAGFTESLELPLGDPEEFVIGVKDVDPSVGACGIAGCTPQRRTRWCLIVPPKAFGVAATTEGGDEVNPQFLQQFRCVVGAVVVKRHNLVAKLLCVLDAARQVAIGLVAAEEGANNHWIETVHAKVAVPAPGSASTTILN